MSRHSPCTRSTCGSSKNIMFLILPTVCSRMIRPITRMTDTYRPMMLQPHARASQSRAAITVIYDNLCTRDSSQLHGTTGNIQYTPWYILHGNIYRAIPEHFYGGDSLRRGAISSVCTFIFYLYTLSGWLHQQRDGL